MKSKVKTARTFHIELNEDEAYLLRAMLQNPLSQDETANERDFRASLWDALTQPEASNA